MVTGPIHKVFKVSLHSLNKHFDNKCCKFLCTAKMQARSQKLLLGGSFGQNVDLFGKIVDKTVDLLNEIEDILSKIMAF